MDDKQKTGCAIYLSVAIPVVMFSWWLMSQMPLSAISLLVFVCVLLGGLKFAGIVSGKDVV